MDQTIRVNKLEFWLQNPIPYRYLFAVFLGLNLFLDGYVYLGSSLTGLYVLTVVLIGLGFENKVFQFIATGLVTLLRYHFSPLGMPEVEVFLLAWLTYFLVSFSLSVLIKSYLQERQNIVNLTRALANSLDSRDPYTANHSENVARYAEMIAEEMKFSKKERENIYIGGLLHDLGKIGISESILMKTSRLTDKEFAQIKKHPVIGYKILKHIPFFKQNSILDTVLYHHERFDGKGYPSGLKGEQIPLASRIMAVADSFDAMTSKRVYRSEKNLEYALNEIRKNIGTQFDPEVAQVFLKIVEVQGETILPEIRNSEKDQASLNAT